jgi:ABC-type dipeptide/oligopeptide/nickel transport system permease component
MIRVLFRRGLFAIFQLFGASVIVFIVVRLLPGDPVTALLGGGLVTPQQIQDLRRKLGLTKPLPEQYYIWLRDALRGDLGTSTWTSHSVIGDIGARLPVTIELITFALLVVIFVLVPIGVLAARQSTSFHAKIRDRSIFAYGMFAGATPDFWLALVLVFVFYYKLRVAPAPLGRLGITVVPPPKVTGFLTIDSILAGNWAAMQSALSHLALPVITLAFVYGAPILKMTRQTVTRMLDSEFAELARSGGLSSFAVLRIAFKNSLPPIITLMGVTYGYVVGGAVLVETVFSWGGLGQYAVQSIVNADFAAIQGFVLIATAISIAIYLAVDLLHMWIDPRVAR